MLLICWILRQQHSTLWNRTFPTFHHPRLYAEYSPSCRVVRVDVLQPTALAALHIITTHVLAFLAASAAAQAATVGPVQRTAVPAVRMVTALATRATTRQMAPAARRRALYAGTGLKARVAAHQDTAARPTPTAALAVNRDHARQDLDPSSLIRRSGSRQTRRFPVSQHVRSCSRPRHCRLRRQLVCHLPRKHSRRVSLRHQTESPDIQRSLRQPSSSSQ
jgi:hypothetical protein